MGYTVRYEKQAQKDLKKMDKFQSKIITTWIKKNLMNCDNPRLHGKGLSGDLSGLWRYRVGDYRIIADIDDQNITIFTLKIGHRREIYR